MSVSLFCILIRTLDRPVGLAVARQSSSRKSMMDRLHVGPRRKSTANGPSMGNFLMGDFVSCLQALTDLHVPVTRDFMVPYEQVHCVSLGRVGVSAGEGSRSGGGGSGLWGRWEWEGEGGRGPDIVFKPWSHLKSHV